MVRRRNLGWAVSEWRVIITDSESASGVAPVCPQQTDPTVHVIGDVDESDELGVYDCCPHPHLECWSERAATRLAAELTAAGVEACS